MLRKPKYKIARRLGPEIFDKTQTQKFLLSRSARKSTGRPKAKSDFALQLLEKQKVRFAYGINERQLKKYVNDVLKRKPKNAPEVLYSLLETRLDNTSYRVGLAPTRSSARQFASHGHFLVNGKSTNTPSYRLQKGDILTIRDGSKQKMIFSQLDEKLKDVKTPDWILFDAEKKEATVAGVPKLNPFETIADLSVVLEFYKR
ncbi:MAG: 30S ribosomal protein S4 [bacterium]|nr:30S ribosomal protein S4 [bacterium]